MNKHQLIAALVEEADLGALGNEIIHQTGMSGALLTFAEASIEAKNPVTRWRLTDHIVKMLKAVRTIERSLENGMVIINRVKQDKQQGELYES